MYSLKYTIQDSVQDSVWCTWFILHETFVLYTFPHYYRPFSASVVDYFSRFWWLAGWAFDPRGGEVLLPFHDLLPKSRTFGPRRILPCLLDQLAPRVATKKNGTRVLPGLGSTPGKWSCWRPVELLHRGWCYSSSSMRHLLPTLIVTCTEGALCQSVTLAPLLQTGQAWYKGNHCTLCQSAYEEVSANGLG
jgi:hypothetical protein